MQAHSTIAGRCAGLCGGGDESLRPAWLLEHWVIGLDGVRVPVLGCWGQGIVKQKHIIISVLP